MKKYFISVVACTLLLFIFENQSHAEQSDHTWDELLSISEKIYQTVNDKQYNSANEQLKTFDQDLEALTNNVGVLDDTVYRTITTSKQELQQKLTSDTKDERQLKQSALQLNLIMDALAKDSDPLWKSLQDPFLTAFNKVEKDVNGKDDRNYQYDLNQFMELYKIIYPALVVDISPSYLKRVDNEINELFDTRSTTIQNKTDSMRSIKKISNDLERIFTGKMFSMGTLPSSFWVSGSLGGMVLLTLIYVVWRKYRGENRSQAYPQR